jgi:tRNA(Arg) A34 adenosine deaminase TadA
MSALAASGVLLGSARAPAAENRTPIRQPSKADARHFMQRAIAMRDAAVDSGDQPYGAVIVRGGRIVGQAPSRVIVNADPTAHAEMEAIRDAARRLGTRDLSGCEIYASSRPCRMCETAAYWANLSRMHHGVAITDAGAPGYSSC